MRITFELFIVKIIFHTLSLSHLSEPLQPLAGMINSQQKIFLKINRLSIEIDTTDEFDLVWPDAHYGNTQPKTADPIV